MQSKLPEQADFLPLTAISTSFDRIGSLSYGHHAEKSFLGD